MTCECNSLLIIECAEDANEDGQVSSVEGSRPITEHEKPRLWVTVSSALKTQSGVFVLKLFTACKSFFYINTFSKFVSTLWQFHLSA